MASIAVTNPCPLCVSWFCSHASAQQHLNTSYTIGRCVLDQSYMPHTPGEVRQIHCLFCDEQLHEVSIYHRHVRQHITLPRSMVLDDIDQQDHMQLDRSGLDPNTSVTAQTNHGSGSGILRRSRRSTTSAEGQGSWGNRG